MVSFTKTFDTREEAEAWGRRYLREFHPCGYGTTLTYWENLDGETVVRVSRLSSCD
jgi:hypothetical protein